MPVSATHVKLLQLLLKFVNDRKDIKNKSFIYHDNPAKIGDERPWKIGNSYPDLLVEVISTEFTIIGEAKASLDDLSSQHAKKQFIDYFKYLLSREKGEFLLAVPKVLKIKAEEIIQEIKKKINLDIIKIQILTM